MSQTQPIQAISVIDQVKNQLSKPESMANLKANLPSHIKPERFVKVALMALQKTPKLLDADRASFYLAIQACAQDGLLPDGREAALVPYGNTVQYLPMIAGILKKVRNSGELKSIMATTVYKKDAFDYFVDENGEHLSHKPELFSDRGDMIGVYALAQTKDGGIYMQILTKAQIEKVRSVSKQKDGGPWTQWYEAQAEKTALKRLCKRLPLSTDILGVIEKDDEAEEIPEAAATVVPEAPPNPPRAGKQTLDAVGVTENKPVSQEELPV